MWDLIVSVPDHCLSFYFIENTYKSKLSVLTNNTHQYACLLLSRQTKNNGMYATFMIRSTQEYA